MALPVAQGVNNQHGVRPWSDGTVIGLKIFVVALVIAGLATACIFSGLAIVGAGSSAAFGFGLIAGLTGVGAVGAPFIAHYNSMGKRTPHNWKDAGHFVGVTAIVVLFPLVGACTCMCGGACRRARRR